MARLNDTVEAALIEYADLLSILTDDPYKPRSYEKAARAVGGYPDDLATMDLKEILKIPSVGKSIGEKIDEFVRTGSFEALDELRAQIPPGVREMTAIPGLGPKKAILLYRDLGIADVEQLAQAVEQGRLAEVKGFGAKTEENIRRGIERMSQSTGRVLVSRGDGPRGLLHRAARGPQGRAADRVRGLAAADGRDDRRPRPPRRERRRGRGDGGVHLGRGDRTRAREGRHEVVDPDAQGPAGRPARGPARGVGRGDDVLHRLEGAQHPDPRDGRPQGPQAQRVRAVPREVGQAHRRRDRGGGLREALAPVDPADAARGSRRGRGGARGHAARRARPQASCGATCTRTPT